MYPARTERRSPAAWQAELARGYQRVEDVLSALGLTAADCGVDLASATPFPLRVPRGFVRRMRRADPGDPLLMQILPLPAEGIARTGYVSDPVGDLASSRAPGLLQKYAARALLITTGACAIHCRYCFRREYPYAGHSAAPTAWPETLADIAGDASLKEIILSGGDPLVLGEDRLAGLLTDLDAIPHITRIRLHTRVPVVLPERIDATLLATLDKLRTPVVVVVHANHAREIDAEVARALQALGRVSAAVLNQSVLLRGVNASADAQVELAEALFGAGVLPYYLHQLDPVNGAAHFEVPDSEAIQLLAAVSRRLPGYLVPRLVREIEGERAKMLLFHLTAT